MKLIKNLLEKRLELYSEFMLNRKYIQAIWCFYSCFNLALALTGRKFSPNEIAIRNYTFRKFVLGGKINEEKFKRIQMFINKDMGIIIQALNYIESEGKRTFEMGDLYKPSMVGVLAFEFSKY